MPVSQTACLQCSKCDRTFSVKIALINHERSCKHVKPVEVIEVVTPVIPIQVVEPVSAMIELASEDFEITSFISEEVDQSVTDVVSSLLNDLIDAVVSEHDAPVTKETQLDTDVSVNTSLSYSQNTTI